MQIYINRNGERTGPHPIEEINRQLAAGTLKPTDEAWYEGSPGWRPLLSITGVIMPGGASSTAASIGMATPISFGSVRYAGFWIRTVAYLVDCFILGFGLLMLAFFLARAPEDGGGMTGFGEILLILIAFFYRPVCWSSPLQATLGQKICHIRVIHPGGDRISFGRGILRALGMLLSGALLGIGFLMVAFTERKQGLHDMIAGTYVVKND